MIQRDKGQNEQDRHCQLDQIAAPAAEAKHVTGKWILPEHRLRLRR
jgi:hypothetical protein